MSAAFLHTQESDEETCFKLMVFFVCLFFCPMEEPIRKDVTITSGIMQNVILFIHYGFG